MKIEERCPACFDSLHPGYLPMGREYVQCPVCHGTKVFVMYEEPVKAPTRIFLVGNRSE